MCLLSVYTWISTLVYVYTVCICIWFLCVIVCVDECMHAYICVWAYICMYIYAYPGKCMCGHMYFCMSIVYADVCVRFTHGYTNWHMNPFSLSKCKFLTAILSTIHAILWPIFIMYSVQYNVYVYGVTEEQICVSVHVMFCLSSHMDHFLFFFQDIWNCICFNAFHMTLCF